MPTDLEIARTIQLKPIWEIAEEVGINRDELVLFGDYKAKVKLSLADRLRDRPDGKYIDVTAITPTPLGEGKTVTTIGLGQALKHLGKKAFTCIRQPSMGPVFGIKGGAHGGGYALVLPIEDFNLGLTGDIHAITLAHNLLAAQLDTKLLFDSVENPQYPAEDYTPLHIDPESICWNRVYDLNDRAMREIIIGLGGKLNGVPRKAGFSIAVASEVMAILALAADLKDLRERLGRIVVAYTKGRKLAHRRPITARDLKAHGAMAVLLREAIMPTLMQNAEHGPVFVHAGPFGNIAHGNSSIIADNLALKLADYVVTESGFGADLGMEKFFNIKCRISGRIPHAVCLVASIRALKSHTGKYQVVPGRPLPKEMTRNNPDDVRQGAVNLVKHIENVRAFGVPAVVAINRFPFDTDEEIAACREVALQAGAEAVVPSEVWARGGAGGAELAEAIISACEKPANFRFTYEDNEPIKTKIEKIATRMYGAVRVEYAPEAEVKLKDMQKDDAANKLPICMAKTHLSLSHDPTIPGRPEGFTLPVRDIVLSAGAGFLYVLCGEISTMPGMGRVPALESIDLDEEGNVVGLF